MSGAGSFNFRVVLQQRPSGQDAFGQEIAGDWIDVARIWADVRHLNGLEAIKGGADISVVRASVRIRYRAGINADMRLLIDGRPYDIRAVMPTSDRAFLDLACENTNLSS
jgi:SPP1 family predicted phage head-tail adaptor